MLPSCPVKQWAVTTTCTAHVRTISHQPADFHPAINPRLYTRPGSLSHTNNCQTPLDCSLIALPSSHTLFQLPIFNISAPPCRSTAHATPSESKSRPSAGRSRLRPPLWFPRPVTTYTGRLPPPEARVAARTAATLASTTAVATATDIPWQSTSGAAAQRASVANTDRMAAIADEAAAAAAVDASA